MHYKIFLQTKKKTFPKRSLYRLCPLTNTCKCMNRSPIWQNNYYFLLNWVSLFRLSFSYLEKQKTKCCCIFTISFSIKGFFISNVCYIIMIIIILSLLSLEQAALTIYTWWRFPLQCYTVTLCQFWYSDLFPWRCRFWGGTRRTWYVGTDIKLKRIGSHWTFKNTWALKGLFHNIGQVDFVFGHVQCLDHLPGRRDTKP